MIQYLNKLLFLLVLLLSFCASAQQITLIFDDLQISPNDTTCMEVRAIGFENMASMQTTLTWDSTFMELVSAESMLGGVEFGDGRGGDLLISWFDASGQTQTLADSAVLFRFCFNITSNVLSRDSIRMGDDPVMTEFVQFDGADFIFMDIEQRGGQLTAVPCIPPDLGADTAICATDSLLVRVSSVAQEYVWRRNGLPFSPPEDSVVFLKAPHTYTLEMQLSASCRVSNTVQISEIQAPSVQIGDNNIPLTTQCLGRPLEFFGQRTDSIVWLQEGQPTGFGSANQILPTETGNFQLIAFEAQCGLSDTSNITAIVTPDTVRVSEQSCNPLDTGTVQNTLTNQDGCDSLVITTTTLLNSDTTFLSQTSCNPLDTGTVQNTLTNQAGCDSLVITTTTLLNSDTTFLSQTSCNPLDTGTVQNTLTNQAGCDSLVITTTTLLNSDTTFLSQTSCNPLDTGTVQNTLTNQAGCDSLVITTTTLLNSDTTFLSQTSCNPLDTGTVQNTLTNQDGCDSLVITTTTLLNSDTTFLSRESCNPQDTGRFTSVYTNRFGCDSVVVLQIVEGGVPSITVEAPPIQCEAAATFLEITAEGGLAPYLYSIDGGDRFLSNNRFDELGPGTYRVVVEDVNGCRSAVKNMILEAPEPSTLELEEQREMELGDSITLEVSLPRAVESIRWSPDEQISCVDCLSPIVSPLNNTTYQVVIIDDIGCEKKGQVFVRVRRETNIFAPNVFSPNGDDVNDEYKVFIGNGVGKVLHFRIFDRWGTLMHERSDPTIDNIQWDGRYRGEIVPRGVYVFFLDYEYLDGTKEVLSGSFVVLP